MLPTHYQSVFWAAESSIGRRTIRSGGLITVLSEAFSRDFLTASKYGWPDGGMLDVNPLMRITKDLIMDLWSVLEERIKQHGVRVEERLELLAGLKSDHETGGAVISERKEMLVLRVDDMAARSKEALRV